MSAKPVDTLTEGYFRWRCRRGMKELDFILNRYLDTCYAGMTDQQKLLFDDLLAEQDMLLWYWLSGKTVPEAQSFQLLVEQICAAGYHKK